MKKWLILRKKIFLSSLFILLFSKPEEKNKMVLKNSPNHQASLKQKERIRENEIG